MRYLIKNIFKKQSLVSIIFVLFFVTQNVFSLEYYTQKDVLDAKTQAFALYNTAQNKVALEILEKIPKEARSEDIYLIMANIYEDREEYSKAFENLNLLLKINPKSYKAYYNLGLLALKNNDLELAQKNFKQSIKFNHDFAYSYYNLGCCLLKTNDLRGAKKNFIRAITINPNDKKFYYNLALVYKKIGKTKEAQKVLDTYNKMD